MLTTSGKTLVKRYLTGLAPRFAQSIALGIGNTAASASDERLDYEVLRVPITISYFNGTKLVYKASVPEEVTGTIYECGLFSYDENPESGIFSGQILSFFNESENWSGGNIVYNTAKSRWGGQAIAQAPDTDYSLNIQLNLSGYSTSDLFLLAGELDAPATRSITSYLITGNTSAVLTSNGHPFVVGDNILIANVASTVNGIRTVIAKDTNTFTVEIPSATNIGATTVSGTALPHCQAHVTFKTSGKEIRYSVDLNSVDGYFLKSFALNDNAAYVDFDWGAIESIIITFTGRGATFYWDALRILDNDANNPNFVMIGRIVPTIPITKTAGVPLEVQYEMDITIP